MLEGAHSKEQDTYDEFWKCYALSLPNKHIISFSLTVLLSGVHPCSMCSFSLSLSYVDNVIGSTVTVLMSSTFQPLPVLWWCQ